MQSGCSSRRKTPSDWTRNGTRPRRWWRRNAARDSDWTSPKATPIRCWSKPEPCGPARVSRSTPVIRRPRPSRCSRALSWSRKRPRSCKPNSPLASTRSQQLPARQQRDSELRAVAGPRARRPAATRTRIRRGILVGRGRLRASGGAAAGRFFRSPATCPGGRQRGCAAVFRGA